MDSVKLITVRSSAFEAAAVGAGTATTESGDSCLRICRFYGSAETVIITRSSAVTDKPFDIVMCKKLHKVLHTIFTRFVFLARLSAMLKRHPALQPLMNVSFCSLLPLPVYEAVTRSLTQSIIMSTYFKTL